MKTAVHLFAVALGAALPLAAGAQGAAPDDPQIAAIVEAANQVDIQAGRLAERQAQSPQVKAFARRMVVDHTGVNDAAVALAHRLHLTPRADATSRSLQQGGMENLAALRKLQGAAFDRAYIHHEVLYHESVLGAMDKVLIPDASNAQLKALLVKVRPAFVDHLDQAKQIQSELSGH